MPPWATGAAVSVAAGAGVAVASPELFPWLPTSVGASSGVLVATAVTSVGALVGAVVA